MKFAVVVFPGSNCDADAFFAIRDNARQEVVYLWHKDTLMPKDIDCVILPGGFSYGDYLRSGAIARFSPIMQEVISFAGKGGSVLGICNGFQVLTEANLLPGTLMRNNTLNFICKDVYLKTTNFETRFTNQIPRDKILRIPIAHGEGNYYTNDDTLKSLWDNNQVIFQYCSENGLVNEESNPNGSLMNIAGIINKQGNVLGMMPHPERLSDQLLGGNDGLLIFQSIIEFANR